ncbi:MAG: hypothetical protein AB9869_08070 [Verrucomicrobiia bacterium]
MPLARLPPKNVSLSIAPQPFHERVRRVDIDRLGHLEWKQLLKPRGRIDVAQLLHAHEQAATFVNPSQKGGNLSGSQRQRLLGIQVKRIHPLQRDGVVWKLLGREPGDVRLEVRAVSRGLRQDGHAGECPRDGAQHEAFPGDNLWLKARSFCPDVSSFVKEAGIPLIKAPARRKDRDDKPFARVGGQLDRHPAHLLRPDVPCCHLDDCVEGRAVIVDFTGHREPRRFANRSVIAEENVELQLGTEGRGARHQKKG